MKIKKGIINANTKITSKENGIDLSVINKNFKSFLIINENNKKLTKNIKISPMGLEKV